VAVKLPEWHLPEDAPVLPVHHLVGGLSGAMWCAPYTVVLCTGIIRLEWAGACATGILATVRLSTCVGLGVFLATDTDPMCPKGQAES
jgi:hypothetical protein